ncbi:serine/threonine protein kinase [Actinomadura barringtoniae]|uniref:non-specific serine/threonine protein kinase n=1 Tax=Actinomadura barringtoniae TaxID=1427535 RepID=A0A939T7F8_9ACTN|nr:serine/threonine-protein kinase [Actinomadura barringtoniae]MBO2451959.1 serine/threonine protein kinase [Actinomadura barringtoniae]
MYEGRVLGGRYRLESRIGRGGMGEVWRTIDERLDRPVAVKLLPTAADADPDLVARFRREAQLAAVLQHPGVTVVHDIDEDDGLLYLVMELLDGEDLAKVLARRPDGMPVEQAVSYAMQICGALAAAHARGIVHRDIKPANLILTASGWVKICDFGIARFVQSATGLTGSAVIGSPIFMAPEQIGTGEIDGRTDLYALGCLLHQMLCGLPPFLTEKGIPALINAHLSLAPPGPRSINPQVPEEVDRLVLELLAKDPAERPADADTVLQRLQALASGGPSQPSPSPVSAAKPVAPADPVPVPDDVPMSQEERVATEHLDRDRPDLAFPLADHVARERERLLGADHPASLAARHLVGRTLFALDREQDAAPVLHAVALSRSRVLGRRHADTLDSWHLLAGSLYVLGRYAEALPIAGGVAADREALLGPHDPLTLESRLTLGWTLHMLDRNDEALALAQDLVATQSRVLGNDHEDTYDTLQLVGWILLTRGQKSEAEAVAAQVHQGLLRKLGPTSEATVQAQALLSACQSQPRRRRR